MLALAFGWTPNEINEIECDELTLWLRAAENHLGIGHDDGEGLLDLGETEGQG